MCVEFFLILQLHSFLRYDLSNFWRVGRHGYWNLFFLLNFSRALICPFSQKPPRFFFSHVSLHIFDIERSSDDTWSVGLTKFFLCFSSRCRSSSFLVDGRMHVVRNSQCENRRYLVGVRENSTIGAWTESMLGYKGFDKTQQLVSSIWQIGCI